MKCRVCGFALDGRSAFCPMCGTKVESTEQKAVRTPIHEEEFSWNTYDFPKPKQMQDIKMEWSGNGRMNNVASEGFIQSDTPVYHPQPEGIPEKPSAPQSRASVDPELPSWHMPEQKVADDTPLWATQPLWDARNLPQELQEPSMPEAQMFTARGYIQTMPIPSEEPKPEPEKRPAPQPMAPEQFHTFYSKNDEFQKLLDEEYERSKALRGGDATLQPTRGNVYAPQETVVAADIDAFEQMLNAGTRTEDELMDQTIALNIDRVHKGLDDLFAVGEFGALENLENLEKTKVIGTQLPQEKAPENADALEALLSEMKDDDNSLDAVRVRNTIETKIREIREREAQNKRMEMSRVREVYFNALDEANGKPAENAPVVPVTEMQPEAAAPEEPKAEELSATKEIPAADAPQTPEIPQAEAVIPQPVVNADTEAAAAAAVMQKAAAEPAKELSRTEAFDNLLTEVMKQEPEEPKRKRSHWFGKLLIAIIILLVVLEAVIMGLRYFIPDHEITQLATFFEQTVIDMVSEGWKAACEFVTGLIAKYLK